VVRRRQAAELPAGLITEVAWAELDLQR